MNFLIMVILRATERKKERKQAKSKPLTFCLFLMVSICMLEKITIRNDELSFKFANGGDWWFHAKNMAGSHVIVMKGTSGDSSRCYL